MAKSLFSSRERARKRERERTREKIPRISGTFTSTFTWKNNEVLPRFLEEGIITYSICDLTTEDTCDT